jgi:hypothetical protein
MMIEYLILASFWVLILSQFYRVYQFRIYIEQNKVLLAEMSAKNKQLLEIVYLLNKLEEITE